MCDKAFCADDYSQDAIAFSGKRARCALAERISAIKKISPTKAFLQIKFFAGKNIPAGGGKDFDFRWHLNQMVSATNAGRHSGRLKFYLATLWCFYPTLARKLYDEFEIPHRIYVGEAPTDEELFSVDKNISDENRKNDGLAFNANSNSGRVFSDIISVQSWHQPFDCSNNRVKLYANIVFRKARLGGEDYSDIRFELSVKKAEIIIDKKLEPIGFDYSTAVNGSRGVISDFKIIQNDTGERNCRWDVSPKQSIYLDGPVWDSQVPIIELINTQKKLLPGLPPSVSIRIICFQEDLYIERLGPKNANDPKYNTNEKGYKNRKIAAECYIREKLCENGLEVGNIHEEFSKIIIAHVPCHSQRDPC